MALALTGTTILLIVAALLVVILAVKIIKGVIRMLIILGIVALAFWYLTKML